MGTVLDLAKFSLFLFFGLFVPGYVLATRINLADKSLKVFLSIALGMVLISLAGFVGIYFVWALILIALLLFLREFKSWEIKSIRIPKITLPALIILLVIALGFFFQNGLTFQSGRLYGFGVGYWGPLGHDGIWHQALVNQILNGLPVVNPGLSGTLLTNYHYFYDLLVAVTVRLTGIAPVELIFRFYPGFFSILLGAGTYLLCKYLFNKWYVGAASLFFVYFGGSFGYIVEWLRQKTLGGESAFWANQPVSMNLNPPFAISLVLAIATVLAFYLFAKRKDFATGIILIVLAGALIEFKVYAGLIILFSLGLLAVIKFIANRDFSYIKVFVPSLLLAFLVYLPNNSGSQNLVVFSPFWLVDTMVEFGDRVGWAKLAQAKATYLSGGLWVKYLLAQGLSLVIFIAGNLGTRIVALAAFPGLLKKKFWKEDIYLFLGIVLTASIVPTLLFIQKGNPWNSVQFIYYFLYFTALFAGLGLVVLLKLLPRVVRAPLVILIILATSVSSFSTFRSAFQGAPSRVTYGELEALVYLKNLKPGIVLTHPFVKELRKEYKAPFPLVVYETSAYVSAYSGKVSFIEDEFQQEIFQNDYLGRLESADKFFYGGDELWNNNFLSQNNISYIYLPTLYGLDINQSPWLEKIFSNSEAEIYKTLP